MRYYWFNFKYVYRISVHWRSTSSVAEVLWLHGCGFRMRGLTKDCSHHCMIAESVSAIQWAHCAWYAIHLKTVQVGRAGGLQDENNIAKGVHHQVGPKKSSAYALHTPLSTPLVLSYFLPDLFAAAWNVLCFRGLRLVQSEWESSMMCGPDTFEKSEFSSSML